jgi:subtilisin family serine protease
MRCLGLYLLIALVSAGTVWGQGFQQRPPPEEPSEPRLRQTPATPAPGFRAVTPSSEPITPPQEETGETPMAVPRPSGGSLMGQALPPPPPAPDFASREAATGPHEPDELLVVSADLAQAIEVQQLGGQMGLGVRRRGVLEGLGIVVTVFGLPEGLTPDAALEGLRARAPHLWADLNHRYTLQSGDTPEALPARLMDWPQARGDCGRGVRIGVLDGPLPQDHPALAGARLTTQSFLPRGIATPPPDHALAVVAILVGRDHGLVPKAELFQGQVMRLRDGRHMDTTVDRLVQGLDWLALQPVDLVNLSLGGPRNLILQAALDRLLGRGIAVVAAAGNQGPRAPPLHPAAQDGVIAVTAVDADGRPYRNAAQGEHITFAAPGVDLWLPRTDGHAHVSGTSFAAPHVTAALAAGRAAHPDADWSWHLAALAGAAKDLGEPGRDPVYGWGLVRAYASCGG